MSVEIEHHNPRISEEDTLYSVTNSKSVRWWTVWFKEVEDNVVEVVEHDNSGGPNCSNYIPYAAESLVCNEDPTLVRYNGEVIAKLVVNDVE